MLAITRSPTVRTVAIRGGEVENAGKRLDTSRHLFGTALRASSDAPGSDERSVKISIARNGGD